MSLVTRATRAPRRSSLWSARLMRWMWAISRARRSYSACSLRRPSRTTAVRWATPAITRATAAMAASTATRPTRTLAARRRCPCRSPAAGGSARRPGPPAPTAARHHVSRGPGGGPAPPRRPAVRSCGRRRTVRRAQSPAPRPAAGRRWRGRRRRRHDRSRTPRRSARYAGRRAISSACVPWSTTSPPLEVHDLVGEGDRRRPRGHHQHGRAGQRTAQVAEHRAARWTGRAPEVVSSSSSSAGRRTSARARAIR